MNPLCHIPLLKGLTSGKAACGFDELRPAKDAEPIFVFVHGTWAPSAVWTREGSILVSGTCSKWPSSGAFRFRWSGANSAPHRLQAAEELAAHLNDLSARFPNSMIIAIGHSHGGNVISWATTRLPKRLHGAVYLNTPFTQIMGMRKVRIWRARFAVAFLSLPLMGVAQLLFMGLEMFATRSFDISDGLETCNVVLSLILGACLNAFLSYRVEKWRLSLLQVVNARRNVSRELVVFVTGDEASAALSSVYFAQWLVRQIGRLGSTLFLASGLAAFALWRYQNGWWTRGWAEVSAGALAVYMLVVLVLFAVAISGYGFAQSLVSLDVPITVTPAPVGFVESTTIAWAEGGALLHAIVHDQETTLDRIAGWLGRPAVSNWPNE